MSSEQQFSVLQLLTVNEVIKDDRRCTDDKADRIASRLQHHSAHDLDRKESTHGKTFEVRTRRL